MSGLVPAGRPAGGPLGRRQGEQPRLGYPRGWLVGAMPVVMQEDERMRRFVSIFEEIASSVRYGVDRCDAAADVTVTSPPMVRYLGGWICAPGVSPELGDTHQRDLVRAAGASLAWRGTRRGLVELLEAVTGGPADVDDGCRVSRGSAAEPASIKPVVVRLATAGHLSANAVVELVRDEVPAHLPIVVIVAGELVSAEDASPGNPFESLTQGVR